MDWWPVAATQIRSQNQYSMLRGRARPNILNLMNWTIDAKTAEFNPSSSPSLCNCHGRIYVQ